MRLKTLRKERPAFENEGTVISGSRMDVSSNDSKVPKHRTNNKFALPTSLQNDSPCIDIPLSPVDENDMKPNVASYQAIEAACLGHGIRIHLNSSTAVAALTQQKPQMGESSIEKKSMSSTQRFKSLTNRNRSQASSALHYSTVEKDFDQDSRPFSAFQQTITTENHDITQSSGNLNTNYFTSSITTNNHTHLEPTSSVQVAIPNDENSITTLLNYDADLAYMHKLLKTASGDTFRDTIRRRAGLRGTFGVHRHSPVTITTTTTITAPALTSTKQHKKTPVLPASNSNYQNSPRHNAVAATAPKPTPSPKKLEKDILKHATRIRTSPLKDYFSRNQSSLKFHTNENYSSPSNSPTRTHYQSKRNKTNKPSKPINLEPLELLLLTPTLCLSQSSSPTCTTSPISKSNHEFNNRYYRENDNFARNRLIKSANPLFIDNSTMFSDKTSNISLNEHFKALSSNDGNSLTKQISSMHTFTTDKTSQSCSIDSGCSERNSSSDDVNSIRSSNTTPAPNSIQSVRPASSSTRVSNTSKKVSFDMQSTTVILTTATYL